jgi:hypothetical protein
MNGVWRRSGMNRYGNEEVAWQRIQDLQREAENRRLASDGDHKPIELVALAWLKRSLVGVARSTRSLRVGRKEVA